MWRSGRGVASTVRGSIPGNRQDQLEWPGRNRSIARASPSSSRPRSRGARRRSSRGCCRSIPGPSCSGAACSAARMIAAILVLLQGRAGLRDFTGMGKTGWLVASLSTLGMVCFIPALQLTSVSNVAIIIATGPFVTAALAWVWLREVPRLRTMLASIVALCGVAIIVGGARLGSDILGIALACFMTVAIAAMTVIVRQHRNTSMVAAAAMSNILGSVVSIPFAHGIAARHRARPVHSRDVRVLPGRARPLAVLHARLAPAAVRPGGADRHAGDAADAVLGVAGVPGGPRVPGR